MRPATGAARALLALALAAAAGCGSEPVTGAPEPEPGAGERAGAARFWETYRAATEARKTGASIRAAGLYRDALTLRPGHADSLHFLAQLSYAHDDLAGARESLLALIESEDRSLRGWQQLSIVQGSPRPGWIAAPAAAYASIKRALDWNPGNSGAWELAARWASYAGLHAEAETAAEAAAAARRAGNPNRDEAPLAAPPVGERAGAGAGSRLHSDDDGDDGNASGGISATIDLDGDGVGDLIATAPEAGAPAAIFTPAGSARIELPAATLVGGWGSPETTTELVPAPWRAAFLHAPEALRLILVGAGPDPVRVFAQEESGSWRRTAAEGMPGRLYGAVMAAGDLNRDGRTDVLLGNVPGAAGRPVVGLWLAEPDGSFRHVAGGEGIAAGAALAADLDQDGRNEVVVVEAARDPALQGAAAGAATSLRLLAFRGQRLEPLAVPAPPLPGEVTDVGVVTSRRGTELFFATGGLTPGSREPDRLWRWSGAAFVDVSEELGPGRFAGTVRALPDGAGGLRVLRGGLVPGDPRRTARLRPRR